MNTIEKIKDAAIEAASIATLRTAPNRGGTYGADGLSAKQLQERFDALPLLVKEKLHELIDAYNGLLSSITSGDLGANIKVGVLTLPEAIDKVASDLLGTRNDNTITTLTMLSAAIGDDPNFAETVAAAISAKSAVKVGGSLATEFDADAFGDALLAEIVDGAPAALDTIRELAAALENNPDFATAIIENAKTAAAEAAKQAVGGKVDKVKPTTDVLYAAHASGLQKTVPYTSGVIGYTVAYRGPKGVLAVAPATDPTHAVPLSQMNEELAPKAEAVDVEKLRKRVVNLEQGITPDPYLTDDSTAYVKDVPADALPYAKLEAVGGMTYKTIPELPIGEYTLSADDINTGHLTEATIATMFPGAVVGKTYKIAYDATPSNGSLSPTSSSGVFLGNPFTLTEDAVLTVNAGGTDAPVSTSFANVRLIGDGFLRETKVKSIESVGKNLFDESAVTKTINTKTGAERTDCGVVENGYLKATKAGASDSFLWGDFAMYLRAGTYRIFFDCYIPTNGAPSLMVRLGAYRIGDAGTSQPKSIKAYDQWERASVPCTISEDGIYYLVAQGQGTADFRTGLDVRFKNITVTTDTTATEYIPYRKHTFPIPAEVQTLDGYGWGVPDGAHNGIEFDDEGKATFVKRVERVAFDGTENWRIYSQSDAKAVFQSPALSPTPKTGVASLCNNSTYQNKAWSVQIIGTHDISGASNGVYFVTEIKTVEEWQEFLAVQAANGNPVTLFYELAEPVVTDISHLITRDNFIEVEGGGIITAVNENADAAPTAIKYQLKEG